MLRANGRALLLSCGRECQQNSPDDADDHNIREISMNAVLPCLHSLDGHYRSMGQALARGEGNQGAVGGWLFSSQQKKRAERDKPTKKHRLLFGSKHNRSQRPKRKRYSERWPSINNTSWPGGVSACRRNIQRCGMKLRVTPLSGLYSRIFIAATTS